jgi:hypothetical protein
MRSGLLDDSNKRKALGIIIMSVGVFFMGTGAGFLVSSYVGQED